MFVVLFYSPRQRVGLCFYRRWFVCLSVCVCMCVCVCMSVTTITKKIVDGFVQNFMGTFQGEREGGSIGFSPSFVCVSLFPHVISTRTYQEIR